MVHNAVGTPVEGDNFFDREREVEDLWSRLGTDNVLLLAPRRVGKTSLMYRLRDTADANGFRAMYLSVAGVPSEDDFSRRLLREAERHGTPNAFVAAVKKITGSLGRRIRKVDVVGTGIELDDGTSAHWTEIGEAIATALHSLGGKWLILIDEVPIFVLSLLRTDSSGVRARAFLNWFRDVRQSAETNQNVRWLLAGSIGLDTVTRRMNLGDTINDLFIYSDFGAFDRPTAARLLTELAATERVALADEVKDTILDRTGWLIPYHLQLWFAELRARCRRQPATVADVDAVHEQLLSPGKKSYFDYWEQRLREELGQPEASFAIALLDAIAADDEGAARQTLSGTLSRHIHDGDERDSRLRYLLDVLVSDGYVVLHDGRYRFRSALLRDFWRRRLR